MQQPRRFQAATLREAYAQVREALGADAVIISTRSTSTPGVLGLGRRPSVEVVAGLPEPATRADDAWVPLDTDLAMHDLVRGIAEANAQALDLQLDRTDDSAGPRGAHLDTLVPEETDACLDAEGEPAPHGGPFGLYARMQALSGPAPESVHDLSPEPLPRVSGAPRPSGSWAAVSWAAGRPDEPTAEDAHTLPIAAERTLLTTAHTAAAGSEALTATLASLAADFAAMRIEVGRLVADRTDTALNAAPEALLELRTRLTEQGVRESLLLTVLQRVINGLRPGASAEAIRRSVERQLAAALPTVTAPDLSSRPAVLLITGPAGAGKTTFALRLALDMERRMGLHTLVASTDVERAGAPQQLAATAAAAGIAAHLCYGAEDLAALLAAQAADVVIVDTPGGTQPDRLAELTGYAAVARHTLLLALPATMQATDLDATVRAYGALKPAGLVLTRCDEAAAFGGLYSAISAAGLGIAYTSHGDRVTDAPRPGENAALAAALTRGRWPELARGRRPGLAGTGASLTQAAGA